MKNKDDVEYLVLTLCEFADVMDIEGDAKVVEEMRDLFPEHYRRLRKAMNPKEQQDKGVLLTLVK